MKLECFQWFSMVFNGFQWFSCVSNGFERRNQCRGGVLRVAEAHDLAVDRTVALTRLFLATWTQKGIVYSDKASTDHRYHISSRSILIYFNLF